MYRTSILRNAANTAKRTVIRDPRKNKPPSSRVPAAGSTATPAAQPEEYHNLPQQQQHQGPLPITPPIQDGGGSVGTLGFYMVAGVGVALGATLVRVVLGG